RVEVFEDIDNVALTPDSYRKKRLEAHRACRGSFEMLNFNGRWEQGRERRTRDGGTVAIYTDITAIKEAERREQQARQTAERANEAKSRFLAAASHDLRQPLHAIGILASVLRNQLQTDDSHETLSSIESCLQTMNNLFDSLLDISKLDAGVIKPEPRPMILADLLSSVHREFHPYAQSKNLKFRVLPSQDTTVSDPGMLGRILRNLVSNALKYTVTGGVIVGVRMSPSGLRIEVYDTGIGFHDHQLSDMFAEFKQLDTGRFKQQGLGLGLSIASRLSDMLGHSLTATSRPGRGSRFTIHVPLYKAMKTIISSDETNIFINQDFKNKCVWVVDDDQDILDAMQKLLSGWGCEVITAASRAQVQASRNKRMPDLLLVDFHLTESLNGLDIIKQIAGMTDRQFSAVVITGDTSPVYLKEIEHLGYSVLHKPLHPMKIRAVIQQQLKVLQVQND
ncbi:MAG: response regulator, partial [Alcaligenaceae bacterium]|nr:response regulator [Alcaligenaceae bacterium]